MGSRHEDALVGHALGTWRIDQKIAQGGMGAIFSAQHERSGQKAAVKVLAPHLASDSSYVSRFLHEARIVTEVRHPNIVELLDLINKPLAVVLASSDDERAAPVVTYQPYGLGRVVVVEGAGMWRWAFLAPRYRELEDVYRLVWQGLMRWLATGSGLAPGRDVALRSDRTTYRTGETAMAVLLARDEFESDSVPVVELQGGDEPRTFVPVPIGDEPGVYRVAFGVLPPGRYTARLGELGDVPAADGTTTFDVRDVDDERLDLRLREDLLSWIAESTGGVLLTGEDPSIVSDEFREHLERTRPTRYRRVSAWDRWWMLIAILGVWTTAWTIRRSSGVV